MSRDLAAASTARGCDGSRKGDKTLWPGRYDAGPKTSTKSDRDLLCVPGKLLMVMVVEGKGNRKARGSGLGIGSASGTLRTVVLTQSHR